MLHGQNLSICLVQLPIPEVRNLYAEGNIPLAAGYLTTYTVSRGTISPGEIKIIPRELANRGGDYAILRWILDAKPDVTGFTNYMWNIERHLYLAEQVKKHHPHGTTIFGGPEIQSTHPLLPHPAVDILAPGEGERSFNNIISDIKQRNQLRKLYPPLEPLNLHKIPDPYLENIITPLPKESLFLETMRGCPYLCKYCFYSKSFSQLRYFNETMLPPLFHFAQERGIPEIYLMDPSFNVLPGLKKRLEMLHQLNITRIPIHTEIRLESVTPEIADLMQKAGFHSVEAGLQSTNPLSLKAIGRTWDRDKFIQGAQLLLERDIDVKTGVILGLPFDRPVDFERTIDFVMEHQLQDSMEIYPLSLIPGTELRDEAKDLELDYMPLPPYWVRKNRFMDEADLKQSIEMVEHKLGIEFFPPIIPHFDNGQSPDKDGNTDTLIYFLDLRKEAAPQVEHFCSYPEKTARSLTILFDDSTATSLLTRLAGTIRQHNPFTLVQLVWDRETIPAKNELQPLVLAFYQPEHYFNRIHHYKMDTQGTYSLRFFHLTGSPETAETYLYQPQYCDLIVYYSPKFLARGRELLEEYPLVLIDTPLKKKEEAELKKIYDGFENLLLFKRG